MHKFSFFRLIFLSLMLLLVNVSYAKTDLPKFSQYPVPATAIYKGKPASVNLTTYPRAQSFRTALKDGAKKGPNFAGHYTIVTIGCGTQCQENWVIDAKTGKIYDQFSTTFGAQYKIDSYLFIANPSDPDLARGYKEHPDAPFWNKVETIYKVWKQHHFTTVHQDKWVNIIQHQE